MSHFCFPTPYVTCTSSPITSWKCDFLQTLCEKAPPAPVDTPGPPALFILVFFLFQDDADYKDFRDIH